jgi:hypothetical protein
MNQRLLIVLASIALLVGGFFIWNQVMMSNLKSELKAATDSVENYHPEGTQGEAFDQMHDLTSKYPDFFKGSGFTPADFSVRSDLEDEAQKFKDGIEAKRTEIRNHVSSSYLMTIGTRPNINAFIEKTDEKFTNDIRNFAAFNPERIDLYNKAVEYCKLPAEKKKTFLTGSGFSTEKEYQMAFVLENAEKNLCPKL